jgi:hypothetical protein
MKRFIFACIALTLLSCTKEAITESLNARVSSNSVTHNVSETTYSIDVQMWSECTGEFVHVTGDVHLKYHAILKEDGGYHIIAHDRNVNIRGVGVTSGNLYKALGVYKSAWNYETKGVVYKVNSRFILMTSGGGNNFVVNSSVNLVVNEDGEFIVSKTEETAKCQ